MYSVEWIPKNDGYNCWNQYVITPSHLRAFAFMLELRLSHAFKGDKFRTRVL